MKKTSQGKPERRKPASGRMHLNPSVDPIETLMEEHERALYYAGQLKEASRSIKSEGFSFEAYVQISEAIRFIDREIRRHNEKEEQFLFPLLARHAAELTQVMRYEHRELWAAFDQLTSIVKDVSDGNIKGSSIVELVQSSQAVAELLSDHIEKENSSVFPMTRELLTAEEYRQLRDAIAGATPHH